jgi:calcineurin-like phosphoesterase family protein
MPLPDDYVGWHDNMLAENWDITINPTDIVWVQGDLSLQGTRAIENALEWMAARPGTKYFIWGNHDGGHPGIERKESRKWFHRYTDVFDFVAPFARIRINGEVVHLSHFPYQGGGDHTIEERFTQWRLPYLGDWLLHGHTHSREKYWDGSPEQYPGAKHQIHIGVDAWGYTPAPQDEVAKLMEEHS